MILDFSKRSAEIEIMDNLNCSGDVVNQTLKELDTINKLLGGNKVTLQGIESLVKKKLATRLHVVDLGCGSGELLKIVAQKFRKSNPHSIFSGIDANPNIVQYAQKHVLHFPEVRISTADILDTEFKQKKFDIILATLFFHHFSSTQLIQIFKGFKQQTSLGVVINDLHRHWLAYYSIKILTRFFSRSSMVKYDAPLSVHRGFKRTELMDILHQAGIKNYTLKWKWAFRWQVVISTA